MNQKYSVNKGGRRWIRALLAAVAVCILGALAAAVLLGTCSDDDETVITPVAAETIPVQNDETAGALGLALPEDPQKPDIPVASSIGFGTSLPQQSTPRAGLEIEVTHAGEMAGDRYPGIFTAMITGEAESYVTLTADYSFSNEKNVYDLILDAEGHAWVDFTVASDGRVSLNAVYSRGEPNPAEAVTFKVDGKAPSLFVGEAVVGDALLTGLSEPGAQIILTAPGVCVETIADCRGAYAITGHILAAGVEYTVTAKDALGNGSQEKFIPEKASPAFDIARSVAVTGVEAAGTSGENGMITLNVSGIAEPGSSVDVFVNGEYCMCVAADADGIWTAVIIAPVSVAGYDVKAMYAE